MSNSTVGVMGLVRAVKDNDLPGALRMLHSVVEVSPFQGMLLVAQASELLEGAEYRRLISAIAVEA